MIRFVLRLAGVLLLAAAFVAVLYDGTKTIAGDELSVTPLGLIWTHLHAESLQALQAAAAKHAPAWIWDRVATLVLAAPAALVLGILGAVLMLLGRKKKPLIGYGR